MSLKVTTLGLILAASAQAVPTISWQQTADNQVWGNLPDGFIPNASYATTSTPRVGSPVNGYYDAFQLHLSGTSNETITSLTFGFSFSGLFDDSVGIDLNGDGTIDYAVTYGAFDLVGVNHSTDGWFNPWADSVDAQNVGIVVNINASGASATTYLYGQAVSLSNGSFNNLSSINLASLGLSSLDGTGSATSTGSLRVGFLNQAGSGGGQPSLNTANFNYNSVPEPSTYGLMGLAALGVAFAARRRKLKTA